MLVTVLVVLAGSGTTLAVSEIDGAEDFAQIARTGFSLVVDGDFFGGEGFPNLAPDPDGNPRNSYAWSMAWFEGQLYVGTVRDVLCFEGSGALGDLGDCMRDDEGNLVIGNEQRGEIWRYTPSLHDFGLSGTWERIHQAPFLGFPLSLFLPGRPRDVGYRNMLACDAGGTERLYVTSFGFPGLVLFYDGFGFTPTSTSGLYASTRDLYDQVADLGYRAMACFKGRLWTSPAGSFTDVDGTLHPVVLMNPDPAGGAAWQTVVDTQNDSALGDPGNGGIFQMAVLEDDLYLSVGNRDTGFELWKGDGGACAPPPGSCNMTWSKVIDEGGGRPPDGRTPLLDNAGATLGVFREQLYVAPAESGFFGVTEAELMRLREDDTWELLVGWPRLDFAGIGNMHCPLPMDLDSDTFADDCLPSSYKGPGLGSSPTRVGPVSYFWRFAEHDDTFFAGTLELYELYGQNFSGNEPGFDLYRSDNGVNWTPISVDGFANQYNYGVRSIVSVPDVGLAVGTANPFTAAPGGTEVWIGTTAPGEEIAPIAHAGDDQWLFDWDLDETVEVELDASQSTDPFGGSGIISFEWFTGTLAELGGDCSAIAETPLATGVAPVVELASYDGDSGSDIVVHVLTLRAEDPAGLHGCDEVTITASFNLPPTATIAASVPFAPPTATTSSPDVRLVDFDGVGSQTYEVRGTCADNEGDIARCEWYLPNPGIALSDSTGCYGVSSCELTTDVQGAATNAPVLLAAGVTRPDVILVVEDGAGYVRSFSMESFVQAVVDAPEVNDRPVCRSAVFSMIKDHDTSLVIDPTGDPRLCVDPDADTLDSELTYGIRVSSRYPPAQHGTATANGALTYTPEPDFVGSDTFYFRAFNPGALEGDDETSWTVGVKVDVLEDLADPEVAITFPLHGDQLSSAAYSAGCGTAGNDICGTASDDAAGVEEVRIAIQDDGGLFWDGGAFTSATALYHAVSGREQWSFAFAPPEDGEYTASVMAEDALGKEAAVAATFETEAPDVEAPEADIVFPVAGGQYTASEFAGGCGPDDGTICGTASDDEAGVASVAVSIRREADGTYWNGASFAPAADPIFLDAAGTNAWSFPFTPPGDGMYTVTARATDGAGNDGTSDAVQFEKLTDDLTAPRVTITFPAHRSTHGSMGFAAGCGSMNSDICGTSTDDASGVASVAVSILRRYDRAYWNGAEFVRGVGPIYHAVAGTDSWIYPFRPPESAGYTVSAVATDREGNESAPVSAFFFLRPGWGSIEEVLQTLWVWLGR
jgi:hypothetical protein